MYHVTAIITQVYYTDIYPSIYCTDITDRDIKKILGEMKENGSIVGGDAVAHRLWREKGLGDVSLNREQWESLRNAMKNKFYLIQGPPGETGKCIKAH